MRKYFFWIGLFVGVFIFLYLVYVNEVYNSNLIEIKFKDVISLNVESSTNERGIYVLNRKYYISSSALIVGEIPFVIEDPALWRPKGTKYRPTISDISAPFAIFKNANSDTIYLDKSGTKLKLLLPSE